VPVNKFGPTLALEPAPPPEPTEMVAPPLPEAAPPDSGALAALRSVWHPHESAVT
jgi:hypothetical protein